MILLSACIDNSLRVEAGINSIALFAPKGPLRLLLSTGIGRLSTSSSDYLIRELCVRLEPGHVQG